MTESGGGERLDELRDDPLWGLVRIDPDQMDTIVAYDACSRVGGRPALEIVGITEPELVDESEYPGVSPPRCTFGELVAEYGCSYTVKSNCTYVIPAVSGDRGLYGKYEVRRDGEPVEDCFVLEPESDDAALQALRTYAQVTDDDELRDDLWQWIHEIDSGRAERGPRV